MALLTNTDLHGGRAMSPFTAKEIEYLRGQRLGRLATAGADGAPHVVPVGFRLDAEGRSIEIGGHGLTRSKKWRDLHANPRAAFVVDDLASVSPWTPRGIEIRGRVELHGEGGTERFGAGGWDPEWLSIVPNRIVSWGIEGASFSQSARNARTVGAP
jgi:pyridoxamine 5'-phosphate oxidase family protein